MPSNSQLHNKLKNADQPEFSYLSWDWFARLGESCNGKEKGIYSL